MEKRGSDEAGSAAQGVVACCLAFSYKARSEPSSDTKRTLGDRALPDLMAAANAADPEVQEPPVLTAGPFPVPVPYTIGVCNSLEPVSVPFV